MSSWKSADKKQQREHRERSQLSSRKQYGFLEKKKDYKKRAIDYQQKQNTLRALKRKALDRNPDEFYFHMINSQVEDGEHHEKQKIKEDTEEELMLMRTQDLNYVNMCRTKEMRKVGKLKSDMHLLDVEDKPRNQHIFFVDSKEEVKNFDLAKRLDTHPSLLARTYNRPHQSQLKDMALTASDVASIEEMKKIKQKRYKELQRRIDREKKLDVLSNKMVIRKQLLNKKDAPIKKIKTGGKDSAPVYLWRQERKR